MGARLAGWPPAGCLFFESLVAFRQKPILYPAITTSFTFHWHRATSIVNHPRLTRVECVTLPKHLDTMSNPSSQPAFHPDISAFLEWVESNSVTGTLGPASAVNHPFMPLAKLERYLKEKNRTRTLLRALFPNRDPPIEPEEIWHHCIRVFSILLMIGKADFIQYFVKHAQLSDSKLPFHRPSHFPPTPAGDDFVDSFFEQQWRFCPHTFSRTDIDVHLEKECVLPIVSKELLGDGGSSSTYKIELHPDYDDLAISTGMQVR